VGSVRNAVDRELFAGGKSLFQVLDQAISRSTRTIIVLVTLWSEGMVDAVDGIIGGSRSTGIGEVRTLGIVLVVGATIFARTRGRRRPAAVATFVVLTAWA